MITPSNGFAAAVAAGRTFIPNAHRRDPDKREFRSAFAQSVHRGYYECFRVRGITPDPLPTDYIEFPDAFCRWAGAAR